MKIKLTKPSGETDIVSLLEVERITAHFKNDTFCYIFANAKDLPNDGYTFEILEEENKGSLELETKQPTNQMTLSEHLQKIKELIG